MSFRVYSLCIHQVAKPLTISRFLHSFASSDQVVAVVRTLCDFHLTDDVFPFSSIRSVLPVQLLFTSPSLALFTHPARFNTNHVSVSDIDTSTATVTNAITAITYSQPHPIYSFLHHLLTFASSTATGLADIVRCTPFITTTSL